jgi:hypothetical protein
LEGKGSLRIQRNLPIREIFSSNKMYERPLSSMSRLQMALLACICSSGEGVLTRHGLLVIKFPKRYIVKRKGRFDRGKIEMGSEIQEPRVQNAAGALATQLGGRSQSGMAGAQRRQIGGGAQKPEARSQKPEARSQRPEARGQRAEGGARLTKGKGRPRPFVAFSGQWEHGRGRPCPLGLVAVQILEQDAPRTDWDRMSQLHEEVGKMPTAP